MNNYINFDELSEVKKEQQVKNATWYMLYKYIESYNKLCDAGLDPFEYFQLKGIPLNYEEAKKKLEDKKWIISINTKGNFNVIDKDSL